MEFGNFLVRQQIFRGMLSWTSILLSGIAIVFLLVNIISGLIYNTYEQTGEFTEEMMINPDDYKVSGLMIFAMLVAIMFFSGFIWVATGFLKQKIWADKFMSLYLWFLTIMIPLVFLLYWAGEKGELSKMKSTISNNPELMGFYDLANLDLNIRLILLGMSVIIIITLIINVNLKIKDN